MLRELLRHLFTLLANAKNSCALGMTHSLQICFSDLEIKRFNPGQSSKCKNSGPVRQLQRKPIESGRKRLAG